MKKRFTALALAGVIMFGAAPALATHGEVGHVGSNVAATSSGFTRVVRQNAVTYSCSPNFHPVNRMQVRGVATTYQRDVEVRSSGGTWRGNFTTNDKVWNSPDAWKTVLTIHLPDGERTRTGIYGAVRIPDSHLAFSEWRLKPGCAAD